MGFEVYIEGSDEGWENLANRLGSIRIVGGIPAVEKELASYSNEILEPLYDIALLASVMVETKPRELDSAIELAALIQGILEKRKSKNG